MPAGKGRFTVGAKGTHGCKGYPVVGGEGKVHGCHPTLAAARNQQAAIYAAQEREAKKAAQATWTGFFYPELAKAEVTPAQENDSQEGGYDGCGCETCKQLNVDCPDCPVCSAKKADMPASCNCPDCSQGCECGDCMDCGGTSMGKGQCCPDDVSKQAPCWEGYVQRGMKPGANGKMVPNCVPVEKAEDLWEDSDDVVYDDELVVKADTYSPPAGARAAARKAIKFKEDGKANGAGTSVGWTRARQLANGEALSLSTVKRMYSYFSRHEVDKKGKDWGNNSNPSNGYIMWLAWGGDAGYSWSKSIATRETSKSVSSWSGTVFDLNPFRK